METITGYVERITFQNPDTGYTVAQLQQPKRKELTCIVGNMPMVRPGETVRCIGKWQQHLVHGRQFIVEQCFVEAPADVIGIKKYLGSGLIKGIGHTYAGRIVEKFGAATLKIIDETPEQLLEVEGLGRKRLEKITSCWTEQKSIREVMIFLQSHGISPTYAQKIFKKYGANSIQYVKETPFHLARDIFGIGFKTADTIATKLGIQKEADQRIDAGIEYTLSELSNDGHVCFPQGEFLIKAEEILEVPKELIERRLSALQKEGRIECFDLIHEGKKENFIWLKALFVAEVGIAREIQRLKQSPCHLRQIDTPRALEWVEAKQKIQLAAQQKTAVEKALQEKVQVITGGPGTGKSTITKAILAISEKLTDKIILAAPTGRAAKRMSEITGKKASTIHSLLEFDFKTGKFKRNRESPLEADLIIIDEASMIDTFLMYSLLKAIPNSARIIFVGDINQLPSVGPGNVLKDLIRSQCISVTMLTEIFRQAAGSKIITNAHRINSGLLPDIRNTAEGDFFFVDALEPEQSLNQIVALVSQRVPIKYGFDPIQDIQVLAPMKRGVIGTENLNVVLQKALNPKNEVLVWGGKRLAVADKVMQIRNNYTKEVFNGDIGKIIAIDSSEEAVVVNFDGREVIYEFSELDELVLSYAVSIHKYQGSQCRCIILPMHTSHFKLLTRNLFYTAVTRAEKLVIVVGMVKAMAIAVHNDEVKKRYTGLCQALIGLSTII